MNDMDKYLGPHKRLGPGSYEIGEIHTTAKAPRSSFWGVQAGAPRGESRRPAKKNADFAWDEVMNRKNHYKTETDAEYAGIFNSLGETINRDIAQAKQAAGGHLSPIEKAKSDLHVTINSISLRQAEYQSKIAGASSLGGVYPYYLMDELSLNEFKSTLGAGGRDALGVYNTIDNAYRSALEMKRLSWEMSALAQHLPALAENLSQAEAAVPVSRESQWYRAAEKFPFLSAEINIHLQNLPAFLQDFLVAVAGPMAGDYSHALSIYKVSLDSIVASKLSLAGPYAVANPAINAPLSKPELEALKNLVDMQANGTLGQRWRDYHESLMNSESARHLTATANAFAGLRTRALEAEGTLQRIRLEEAREAVQLQEQARLAAEAEVRRIAMEAEARRVAAEAEVQRIAMEAEARRAAAEAEARRVAMEAEAQRVAAEVEARREAAEAEAQRIVEEQARNAAENTRAANTFHASGASLAAGPLFMTAAGAVAVAESASLTLQAAIGEAVAALSGFAASVGTGAAVGVAALFYSSKLGNGELPERYAFSTPLSDLAPTIAPDLNAAAAAGAKIDLPFRISSKTTADGQSEVFVVKTDGLQVPSQVQVVAATYNPDQKVYTATTADSPPRTLTWTPIVDPGNSSTTLPTEQPAPVTYTGATAIPIPGRLDTFPAIAEAGFDDFVLVFPQDSGLAPIYTMFRSRREEPGVATGMGQVVSGNWRAAESQGEGAPIPVQIANQLRGKEFRNFRAFREALWKAVANDVELAKHYGPNSVDRMRKGRAPWAAKNERVGKNMKIELHHKHYISEGGDVYGIDNIGLVTPKAHVNIHRRGGDE